jgi:hypothetical protein
MDFYTFIEDRELKNIQTNKLNKNKIKKKKK